MTLAHKDEILKLAREHAAELADKDKQIADKVVTYEHVVKNIATVVDRAYYLHAMETPLDNVFFAVTLQRLLLCKGKDKASKDDELTAHKTAKDLLWGGIASVPMSQDQAKRKASTALPVAIKGRSCVFRAAV